MTPTAGSGFSRYVIPDDLSPSGICCVNVPVPNDPQWFAMLSGALWRLSLQTHWERDEAHSAKIVAARWREIWMEVQDMAACCGDASGDVANITINNVSIQIYLQSLKQTWIDALFDVDVAWPETPDLFDSDPGDLGGEVAQRNRALCLAVTSWINELMNRGVDYVEKGAISVTPALVGGLAMPIVPVWIVAGAFAATALVLGELHSQLTETPYREYLICGMFEALKGKDTNSSTDFAESMDNLPARPPPPESLPEDLARDAIEAWARSQLNNVDNYIGFINTLNTAMSVASSLTDEECACTITGTWTHHFLGGDGQHAITPIPASIGNGCTGSYNAIEDRIDECCLGEPTVAHGVEADLTFVPKTITNIKMTVLVKVTRTTGTDFLQILRDDGTPVVSVPTGGGGPFTTTVDTGVISEIFSRLRFLVWGGSHWCADDAYCRITKLEISGEGTDPFL